METRSFKSFKKIWNDIPPFSNQLKNHELYLAHLSHGENEPDELLIEHVELVVEYAMKLIETHHLEDVVNELAHHLLKEGLSENYDINIGNYFKKIFLGAIVFHDYGKVNENFQIEKMKNTHFKKRNTTNKIETYHSGLSAFLFIHFFLNDLKKEFSNDEKAIYLLSVFVCLFCNPILKHHAAYIDHFIKFGERKDSLKQYLSLYNFEEETELSSRIWDDVDELFLKKLLGDFKKDSQKPFQFSSYFPFFALMKLNFSLLTASDQYATGDFMSKIRFEEFGTISKNFRKELFDQFRNNEAADYNEKLYERFDYYLNLPFKELQERNWRILNQLRQKLAATAIHNLRLSQNERLFFLEAPTGGGKTNISVACALELLENNPELNKVFYVFPFTTLITQTFSAIKETLQIGNESVIQLHSKAGFHSSTKNDKEDDKYGKDKIDYLNATFLNYPISLMSHIKFFDILKGNGKGSNLILHRVANSIVIIDELQTYDPKHWDKVIFILSEYARFFNVRFILMSATLPKIDELDELSKGKFVSLNPLKNQFFTNPNFKGRVKFNFDLLKKRKIELQELKEEVFKKSNERAEKFNGQCRVLIEFIKKKTASEFLAILNADKRLEGYRKFLISGTILEPRRKEIIQNIKAGEDKKVIVVSTQVVEAGVDIDMDIGFKNRSLIDSDEQFAGRINRNASKNGCIVYLFLHDAIQGIYGEDERYKVTREKIPMTDYKEILSDKNFDKLYRLVLSKIVLRNQDDNLSPLEKYKEHFKYFQFSEIRKNFQLIENDTETVYIPLPIESKWFEKDEIDFLNEIKPDEFENAVNGETVFNIFRDILTGEKTNWTTNAIEKKKIYGIMSKFMFSVYPKQAQAFYKIETVVDKEILDKFGIYYLSQYELVYDYEAGVIDSSVDAQFI